METGNDDVYGECASLILQTLEQFQTQASACYNKHGEALMSAANWLDRLEADIDDHMREAEAESKLNLLKMQQIVEMQTLFNSRKTMIEHMIETA